MVNTTLFYSFLFFVFSFFGVYYGLNTMKLVNENPENLFLSTWVCYIKVVMNKEITDNRRF